MEHISAAAIIVNVALKVKGLMDTIPSDTVSINVSETVMPGIIMVIP